MVSGHERGNIESSDVGCSAFFGAELDEIPRTKWKRRLLCAVYTRASPSDRLPSRD
jgi:hypothetical protein